MIRLPMLPITTIEELKKSIIDTLNRIRSGELTTQQGQAMASLYGQLWQINKHQFENDPRTIAQNQFTAQTARNLANSMTIEQAREIASHRNPELLERLIAEQMPQAEIVEVVDIEGDLAALNKELKQGKEKNGTAQNSFETFVDVDPSDSADLPAAATDSTRKDKAHD